MTVLHVFTLGVTAESFFDGQFKYLSEEGGHEIHLISSSDKNEEFCKRNHLQYTKLNIERRISPFADLKTIKNLVKLIRKEKYATVFGHTPKGAMVAMIAAKLSGIKNRVYYRHGYIYTTATGLKRFILKTVERLTAGCSTKIINVSPSIGKIAVKDHLNSSKKQLVIGAGSCGGIDTQNLFNPELIDANRLKELKQSLHIEDSEFIVGFCGRICNEKGVRELIDGFISFRKDNPNLNPKLLLVGGMDERDGLSPEYKDKIAEDPDIISTGAVDKKVLPLYYSVMDVLVLPSYREGFGMCVIEAGAMGVPALVSRSHGCIDSIKEKETGEYVDISAIGIKNGLSNLSHNQYNRELGRKARKYVFNNFDCSIFYPKILKFYYSIE